MKLNGAQQLIRPLTAYLSMKIFTTLTAFKKLSKAEIFLGSKSQKIQTMKI